ncbi:hypothetical protein ACTXT7_017183 [Hymenolepis weldensis]
MESSMLEVVPYRPVSKSTLLKQQTIPAPYVDDKYEQPEEISLKFVSLANGTALEVVTQKQARLNFLIIRMCALELKFIGLTLIPIKSVTIGTVINNFRKIFAAHGIPYSN